VHQHALPGHLVLSPPWQHGMMTQLSELGDAPLDAAGKLHTEPEPAGEGEARSLGTLPVGSILTGKSFSSPGQMLNVYGRVR
jgi:hypothetical protein